MLSWLVRSSSGLSPGRGHCVVFLGKTLDSNTVSLSPGVTMGTGDIIYYELASIKGRVEVTPCLFMPWNFELSRHLARVQTLPLFGFYLIDISFICATSYL